MDKMQNILGNITAEQLKAAKSGDAEKLLSTLNQQDSAKLRKLLGDEQATKALLNSPAAQELIKALMKKKEN